MTELTIENNGGIPELALGAGAAYAGVEGMRGLRARPEKVKKRLHKNVAKTPGGKVTAPIIDAIQGYSHPSLASRALSFVRGGTKMAEEDGSGNGGAYAAGAAGLAGAGAVGPRVMPDKYKQQASERLMAKHPSLQKVVDGATGYDGPSFMRRNYSREYAKRQSYGQAARRIGKQMAVQTALAGAIGGGAMLYMNRALKANAKKYAAETVASRAMSFVRGGTKMAEEDGSGNMLLGAGLGAGAGYLGGKALGTAKGIGMGAKGLLAGAAGLGALGLGARALMKSQGGSATTPTANPTTVKPPTGAPIMPGGSGGAVGAALRPAAPAPANPTTVKPPTGAPIMPGGSGGAVGAAPRPAAPAPAKPTTVKPPTRAPIMPGGSGGAVGAAPAPAAPAPKDLVQPTVAPKPPVAPSDPGPRNGPNGRRNEMVPKSRPTKTVPKELQPRTASKPVPQSPAQMEASAKKRRAKGIEPGSRPPLKSSKGLAGKASSGLRRALVKAKGLLR